MIEARKRQGSQEEQGIILLFRQSSTGNLERPSWPSGPFLPERRSALPPGTFRCGRSWSRPSRRSKWCAPFQFFFIHSPILPVESFLASLLSFTSFCPKTAVPFPRRWGWPRKGRAVFRREDRAYSEPCEESQPRKSILRRRWRMTAVHPTA